MTDIDIRPFGQASELPAGYPIEDSLDSSSAQRALSARQGKILKEMMAQPSQMPLLLRLGEPTNVIYTIDDFMLAHEYDQSQGIDNLKFSNDLGETWTTVANTYGTILNAFMFADGTFMMATKKSEGCRIYWTRDFATFTEATVLDYNGNPYSLEAGKTRFYTLKPKSEHVYVDGVEHYCFWDYIIDITANPRMWYAISDESGVTVRAAFAFGYSQVNGATLYARHGHAFEFNPHDGYFYVLSGDAASECHVLKGRYVDNNGTHTWTWEKLATGGGYKLVSVSFDEGNMYAITDYTESALAAYKGLVSIPIDKIGMTTTIGGVVFPAKLRYWFHATDAFMRQGTVSGVSGAAALSLGKLVDNHGWRFMGTDYLGGSKHLIAKGDHNFVWVDNNKYVRFNSLTGPNNKGDVYVTYSTPPLSVSGEGWLKLSHQKTYNLTEAMRNSGATDFFDGWLGTPR